jgi:Tfp pilus assembly protein PilZ
MTKSWAARKYKRIRCEQVSLETLAHPAAHVVENISRGGCFIRTRKRFKIGDIYEFRIKSPHIEELLLVNGEIIWQEQPEEEDVRVHGFGYGVSFIEDESHEIAALIDAIRFLERIASR